MPTIAERSQQPERARPRFRTLEVRRVAKLGPHLVRITLAGPELEGFEVPAPTQHVKVILPDPVTGRPVLPDPSLPRGASAAPGQPRSLMRTYTVRRYEPAAAELDVDFVLHGHGPGSDWAAHTQAGAAVALAGPGGRPYAPDVSAGWYVLAGDEAALPAMGTLLERLPSTVQAQVYGELAEPADELPLATEAQLQTTWLHRGSKADVGSLLETVLLQAPPPEGSSRVWLACEANVMRRIRKHLLDGWGLDPATIVTRGYWKAGEPNYRDSDYGGDDGMSS